MSCDLCRHEHHRSDILCQPCREMISRVAKICSANPEVLDADSMNRQAASRRGLAEAAGAKS
jgi:hypothetical protein